MSKRELNILGPAGNLEAILHLTDDADYSRFGIICHPHPLQEGTMNHKVVSTVVKAFNASGISCIRFNFRGVGKSAGIFGNIAGEVEDCLAVVDWVTQQWPDAELYLAGFSFGAYVAAAVSGKVPVTQLITIAPSVERMPYTALLRITCPWLVIQGEEDEVVNPQAVYTWYENLSANKTLIKFPATGHFFHGKLIDLQKVITQNC